ncbi:MAG: hypothetical protein LC667_20440, partial [Thioalkalivibrio sp.]|nr:hypothetical protein [Thioalkalivibrio sp.]
MQIARIGTALGPDFAFRRGTKSAWVTARGLGLELSDLPDLVGAIQQVVERLSRGVPDVEGEPTLWHSPVVRPGKILAVGLN